MSLLDIIIHFNATNRNLREDAKVLQEGSVDSFELYEEVLRHDADAFNYTAPGKWSLEMLFFLI